MNKLRIKNYVLAVSKFEVKNAFFLKELSFFEKVKIKVVD